MSLEMLGLGAIVKFNGDAAIAGMKATGDAANTLTSQISNVGVKAGQGLQTLGSTVTKVGLAFAPLSAAIAFGANTAGEFEKQMSAVKAVADATPEEMALLTKKAKELGTTTQFTATESGKAMEELARAGFTAQETLQGVDGVVAAASADAISLETSASILSSTLRAMGLEAGKTGKVADVLAKASAVTNTNITEMGEALKYAAPVAHTMGMSLSDLVTYIGALADTGIKGTLAGTALKNAMLKLSDPTEKAAGYMEQLGVHVVTNANGSLNLEKTFELLHKGLVGIKDVTKKAAIEAEIFGLRGIPAFTSWETAVARAEEGGNHFVNLQRTLAKEFRDGGAAAKMAETRLDNFLSAMKILGSQVQVFAIEFFQNFQGGAKETVQAISHFLSDVIGALRLLNDGVAEGDDQFKQYGKTATAVATGLKEGITYLQGLIRSTKEEFVELFNTITGGNEETTTGIVKWITIIGFLGGALAPVITAVGTLIYLVGTALTAAFGLLSAPIIIAAAVIGASFMALKQDGESWGETLLRTFNGIKNFVLGVYEDAILPFWNGMMKAAEPALKYLWVSFKLLFGTVISDTGQMAPAFEVAFKKIGEIVGIGVSFIASMLAGVIRAFAGLIDFVVGSLQEAAHIMLNMARIGNSVHMFFGGEDRLTGDEDMNALADFAANRAHGKASDQYIKAIDSLANFGKDDDGNALKADYSQLDSLQSDAKAYSGVVKDINDIGYQKGRTPMQVDLTVEDKRQIDMHNCVNVDGRALAVANARNQTEVNERRGFKDLPWQRRIILEQGASASVSPAGG